jgi:putative hemolysin
MGIINSAKNVKSFLESLDSQNNPKESLKRIVDFSKRHPAINNIFKGVETYGAILSLEERAKDRGWIFAANESLRDFGVSYEIIGERNIPSNGGALYVANHLYGILDGLVLIGGLNESVEKKGKVLKIIGNTKLKMIDGIEKIILFVNIRDNFNSNEAMSNVSAIRDLRDHFSAGGDLAVFPAGQASGCNLEEHTWNGAIGKIVKYCECVVPMWFNGPNHGFLYNTLSRVKSELRGVAYLAEAWNKKGEKITLVIGEPINKDSLLAMGNGNIVSYIRKSAESLLDRVKA